ncbi:hypothetical protein [Rhodospirillum centenum]|uniref:Uncharacterized protein n=1 Tax=Rhodospirillum centenum (strain ATCC 51521 / SW) TaxID=414684 RepID=B6IWJ9_RHOCS|nr:hypothetical protein [Rhodospirillum centenum]ACJ00673.1 hypothetical protein RC1_3312 [Rhodospirillum centenum SW]
MRVKDVLNLVLPRGSGGTRSRFGTCPWWPPDVFAVAAMLVEMNGTYAHPACMAGWSRDYLFSNDYVNQVVELGRAWRRDWRTPRGVSDLWRVLVDGAEERVASRDTDGLRPWQAAAVRLLATADEACRNIGFVPDKEENAVAWVFLQQYVGVEDTAPDACRLLPHLPVSLCTGLVPPDVACVQPKTNTPRVGCTLRSLTHHIALLPGRGIVETQWRMGFGRPAQKDDRPLNLLLVPLPYAIRAEDFKACDRWADDKARFFRLVPGWLHDAAGEPVAADTIVDFLRTLVHAARREAAEIHGIVLPESALLEAQAGAVADLLARDPDMAGLELFVSGAIGGSTERPRNEAMTFRFFKQAVGQSWSQAKHHRWRLDKPQVRQYHLGHLLDPTCLWWEQIDVSRRVCHFTVVRRDTTLSVLICEDLARVDPVLPAVNAIGPNLVIALLMDGPQLERRWPGRYATVLAEDPGSSVLTLTSIGMIRRSQEPGAPPMRQIALWKEPGEPAKELHLGPGQQALLLSLRPEPWELATLDTRADRGRSRRWRLVAAHGISARLGGLIWPSLD